MSIASGISGSGVEESEHSSDTESLRTDDATDSDLESEEQDGFMDTDIVFTANVIHARRKTWLSKPYTIYTVAVECNNLRWKVQKRYSDFHKLHWKLKSKATLKDIEIPNLPPKKFLGNMKQNFVEDRKRALGSYVQSLLSVKELHQDFQLMQFFEMVSIDIDEKRTKREIKKFSGDGEWVDFVPAESEVKQGRINIAMVDNFVEVGDVIMFQSTHVGALIIRTFTNSDWDHVGVVIRKERGRTWIMESTGDEGVAAYPLTPRLAAYAADLGKLICVRKLEMDHRPSDLEERAAEFCEKVEGNPFEHRLSELATAWIKQSKTIGKLVTHQKAPDDTHMFCSETVARAFQHLGLLKPGSRPLGEYLPKHFSSDSEDVPFVDGVRLEPEVVIDFTRLKNLCRAVRV